MNYFLVSTYSSSGLLPPLSVDAGRDFIFGLIVLVFHTAPGRFQGCHNRRYEKNYRYPKRNDRRQ